MERRTAAVGAILALLGAASCSDDGPARGTLAAIVDLVPAEGVDDRAEVFLFTLHERAWEQLAVDSPRPEDIGDWWIDAVPPDRPVMVPSATCSLWDHDEPRADLEDALGFSHAAVTAMATSGGTCVITGDFDGDSVLDTVRATGWDDVVQDGSAGDHSYLTWDFLGGLPADGVFAHRSGFVVAEDGVFVQGIRDTPEPATLAALDDEGSLLDAEGVGALVEILDAEGVHSALISPGVIEGAAALCAGCDDEEVAEVAAEVAFTDGVVRWGAGWGSPEEPDEEIVTIVAISADEADAADNTVQIERQLRDGISVRNRRPFEDAVEVIDAETIGQASVVRIRGLGSSPGRWVTDAVFKLEPLVVDRG